MKNKLNCRPAAPKTGETKIQRQVAMPKRPEKENYSKGIRFSHFKKYYTKCIEFIIITKVNRFSKNLVFYVKNSVLSLEQRL